MCSIYWLRALDFERKPCYTVHINGSLQMSMLLVNEKERAEEYETVIVFLFGVDGDCFDRLR